ncbi:MAG: HAMP domain-containing protein [Verrucomicrobia bacterium]|nr:HAMP domain-containing protein [Verrucomicrobiota bacterium]
MLALSFRTKLLWSMMLAVACVAGATLVVTQRKVHAEYEKLFNERLDDLITYLPKEQEARLSAVKEKCRDLVRNVRFLSAIRAGDEEIPYLLARDQLLIATGIERTPAGDDPAANESGPVRGQRQERRISAASSSGKMRLGSLARRVRQATSIAFVNAEGKLIEDPMWKQAAASVRERVHQQMVKLAPMLGSLDKQEVGYLAMDTANGAATLIEIIVTPIRDSVTGLTDGAMVLGFPFQDNGEEAISDVSDVDNGVWVGGRLFSRTIPAATVAELNQRLPGEISQFKMPREQFLVTVTNIPHRVYYTPLNAESKLPVAYKVGLYSWEGALKAQRELRWQILGFSGLALVGALGLSLFLAHNLSEPLNALTAGTAEIQRGNFSVKIPVRSRDEIGRLTTSFNEMAEGLALKDRYHNLLHMVTDKDVAQELISGKFALGGELREASVIFCDIRGFTPLTQGMDPAEVIQMLNEHMTALASVVNEHHGIVDKFIGDCVMAVFGAPKSYGDDAGNAALCALKMIRERQRLNASSRYQIDIGIGVATGQLVAGNMGSQNRLNYTVLGENVNLAARLCSVAGRMEVVISAATLAQLGGRAEVTALPDLKLKGFTGGVSAAKLLAVKPA